jgi:hypothetical protein
MLEGDERPWALLDSQFDDVLIRNLGIRHDIHDEPREEYLSAPEA